MRTQDFKDLNEQIVTCTCELDRLRILCIQNPTSTFLDHPGFLSGKSQRITPGERFEPYGRAHWLNSKTSSMSFCIESKPREPWSDPFRVTLIADNSTGLLPQEVFAVLELLTGDFKLSLVELPFDFVDSTVDRTFVLNYGLFGRSRRAAPRFASP